MESVCEDRENLREFLEEAELPQYHELFRDILKVTKVSQLKFVVTEDLAHIGLSKPEQRRYKKIYAKYFPNPYISKIKKLLSSNKKNETYYQAQSTVPVELQPFPETGVKIPTKHIISVEDITINKELGMGQFGVVQQGTWATGSQRLQVAIKCLGHERMTSNSTEFLKEAAVMHSIEHPNIVRLYGVVLHMDSLMLVTELAPLRSLLECLREVSLRANFPVGNLCQFAEQICDGMTYLENKRLIHRDLAARNILVFNADRVKISDFGLSRALGVGKDYYQTNYNVNLKLPVAWSAPECILYLRFTSASDVWAFGVTLWEMFTYGFQPWAAFSGQQILEAIDAPNYQRLESPECCPPSYYDTMLECWSDDPNDRPNFKDLAVKLREIRPDQVQATVNYQKLKEARRNNFLDYKIGQVITVLGKEEVTKTSMWYGVLPGGACGVFDPNNTKPYVKRTSLPPTATVSPRARPSLLRSDVKRHTYTGKRTIQRTMISSPQGEVKHTGHVGLDGAYFGDISFLDPAGCPPRQVVTPYKPSEDLEQMPLINPNSPSHLTGGDSSTPPYPLLTASRISVTLPTEAKSKSSQKKPTLKPINAPTTSKSIMNKVKSATLGRSFKSDEASTSRADEVHEYHEISDTDTESNATEHIKTDNLAPPESPCIPKNYVDFSQSLLEEMETMFRSLDGSEGEGHVGTAKDLDNAARAHTLHKIEKKKRLETNTMKPMSAHDRKTLDTAVALANELTTRSMNDLGTETSKPPHSPADKYKFHFKFPSLHHHHHHNHTINHHQPPAESKDVNGKQERRNFSEEAKSVQDIHATLTEESKIAYASLIEQPTPCSTLVTQIATDQNGIKGQAHSLGRLSRCSPTNELGKHEASSRTAINGNNDLKNELPLPPRTTKTKMVDKPRHIRKHPLILGPSHASSAAAAPPLAPAGPAVTSAASVTSHSHYQNLITCRDEMMRRSDRVQYQNVYANGGVDVCDGVDPSACGPRTNPFTCHVNPFNSYVEAVDEPDGSRNDDAERFQVGALVKDCTEHVSVEDLLEFADQKPCGRQRGAESDEVRIMNKVLKNQVSSEECLDALEVCEWNVHSAIKLMRVRVASGGRAPAAACAAALAGSSGDVLRASAACLIKYNDQ